MAGRVLDAAPRVEGFRATAWWERTRAEIVRDVHWSFTVQQDFIRNYYLDELNDRGRA